MADAIETSRTQVIEVSGKFDLDAAERVARAVADADPSSRIVVDLGRVREVQDFGLAVLARVLASDRSRRVFVRGLGRHQLRLLGYLGIEPSRLEVPA